MQGNERGYRRIDECLRDGPAVDGHGIGHHVVADIAHQHETAARQHENLAIRRPILPIRVQAAQHRFAALLDVRLQATVHQSQPVSIRLHLIVSVDGGHRILAVLNGRKRRFQQYIADAGGIVAADVVRAIDVQLHMQSVVDQQQQRWRVTVSLDPAECRGIFQAGHAAVFQPDAESVRGDAVGYRVVVRAVGERKVLVQEIAGEGDDSCPALRVVLAGAGRAVLGYRVGAVQCIVQAAPTSIGRIQGIAGVADRNHQLRPGDLRDLRVDTGGIDGEWRFLGHQIADLEQIRFVAHAIEGRAGDLAVPSIDLRLQLVPTPQQFSISRRQSSDERGKSAPEGPLLDAGARHGFLVDEIVQNLVDIQAIYADGRSHSISYGWSKEPIA